MFVNGLTSFVYLEYMLACSLVITFDCAWGLCGGLLSEKENILFYTHNDLKQDCSLDISRIRKNK